MKILYESSLSVCNDGEDGGLCAVDFRDHFAAAKWIRKYLHYSKKSFGGEIGFEVGCRLWPRRRRFREI